MKKFITTSFFLFSVTLLFSQPAIKWEKNYGGSSDDQSNDFTNYYDAATHILIATADGGFILSGYSASNDIDVSGNHGFNDYMLIKTDASGAVQWSKLFGGSGDDQATSVLVTSDGGYAICGFSTSNDGDFQNNHGGSDVVIVKTDSLGNLQWQQSYGGSADERSYSFRQTSDGGFVVGASSQSSDFDVDSNRGIWDYWIFKTDQSGVLQWGKTYGGTSYDWINCIQIMSDGYIVCGWTISTNGDIVSNIGATDMWVVKVDTAGNLQWQQTFGGTGNEWGNNIIQTSDNGFALEGITESNDVEVSGLHGIRDMWICKMDSTGGFQWGKTIGGSQEEDAYDIFQTPDDGFVITGATASSDGDVRGHYGVWDYMLCKIDATGNIEWSKSLGGSNQDYGMCLVQIPGGDWLMAGNSKSGDFDVSTNYGGWDLWVVRLTMNYNIISGTLFIDANSNGIFDSGETPIANHVVIESNTGQYAFTDSNGVYHIQVTDTGTFDVHPGSVTYYSINPPTQSAYFSGLNMTDSLNDFPATVLTPASDFQISITPTSRFRPGFPICYLVTYSNVGTNTETTSISMILDPNITFSGSEITPDSINNDTLVWNNLTLAPFESASFLVCGTVDSNTPIMTDITTTVAIGGSFNDLNNKDNTATWTGHTTGSYDPNDKSVNTEVIYTDELNDAYLDYVIRFQNTGNDTAFTVVVHDTISANIDMNSFQFVASSHDPVINFDQSMRLLTFTFNNILLPDSTTDEPGSHGFIHFKVRAVNTLLPSDVINNIAGIYFDFNSVVKTNWVTTSVSLPTLVADHKTDVNAFLYPNPSSQFVRITTDTKVKIQKVEMYSLIGSKVIDKLINNESETIVSVSNLNSGMYIVKVYSADGVMTSSMIKK